MLRRVLIALLLSPLLACAQSQAPDTSSTDATLAAEPAAAPADAAPVETAPTEAAPAVEPAASTEAPVAPTTADFEAAPTVASASSTPATKPAAAPAPPSGPEPREGVDYEVLETPMPTWGQGKIEVAEVFGYPCIHCHHFQPLVNEWHKKLPADVRFEYVPAVFGGVWDYYAKAFFAAQLMGVQERTHDEMFNRFHEQGQHAASDEEVAAIYGEMGIDAKRFLSTMQSFGVTAKLQKARQFAMRGKVSGTPTIIVAGKYRVMSTRDRGFPGMLSTVDHLVARERSGAP
jgi:thiol:disulfide interchange protein DsbA